MVVRWFAFVLVVSFVLIYALEDVQNKAYAMKAVQCAKQPAAMGCDAFRAAAGARP